MTQEKLALEAGVERVFVSWLETGRKQPTFGTIMKLACALGCTAADLVCAAEAHFNDADIDSANLESDS